MMVILCFYSTAFSVKSYFLLPFLNRGSHNVELKVSKEKSLINT